MTAVDLWLVKIVTQEGCCETNTTLSERSPCRTLLRSPTKQTLSVHQALLCSEQETKVGEGEKKK